MDTRAWWVGEDGRVSSPAHGRLGLLDKISIMITFEHVERNPAHRPMLLSQDLLEMV